ncbi:hypothetical protein C6P77_12835 [Burkholderia ambifaria]|nr:hypothetical protein C6P77_12835 [Burkholderia ambifaria]
MGGALTTARRGAADLEPEAGALAGLPHRDLMAGLFHAAGIIIFPVASPRARRLALARGTGPAGTVRESGSAPHAVPPLQLVIHW